MSRYIELNKVLSELGLDHKDYVYIDKHEVAERIKKLPSIDIVRCKECKYAEDCEQMVVFENGRYITSGYKLDFCSYGERSTE